VEFKDYYATLGVAKSATEKEIKQAYRKLARKHHPDVNPGDKSAESKFKLVNEAYEVLGNPEHRRKYDELGTNWRQYEQGPPPGSGASAGGPFAGGPFGFGGPGGYTTMNADDVNEAFGADDPFSDFFHAFFGGARPDGAGAAGSRAGRSGRPRKGRDVEQDLELTLEEASQGAMRRLSIKHGGHARSVDVRIPAGVADGSRVRVAGEGEHGASAAPAGDLFLRIRVRPHTRFERKGRDLYTRIEVPVTVAVLGGDMDVRSLDGHSLRLKIPPATQNGQVLRLKGHGMPAIGKPADRGDLYATIDVRLPRELTAEMREHYEALARLEDGRPAPAGKP